MAFFYAEKVRRSYSPICSRLSIQAVTDLFIKKVGGWNARLDEKNNYVYENFVSKPMNPPINISLFFQRWSNDWKVFI